MQKAWEKLPEQFIEKLSLFLSEKDREEVLNAFCAKTPSTFRANTLKISVDDLEKELKKRSIETERVSWYKDAFVLCNVPQKTLTETDLYTNGMLYVQSLSSMIPPLVLNPKENEKVLDITAAPGSKTTQLAALMQNTGEIVANDISRVRLYKLEANLKMQGVTNTKIDHLAAQQFWKKYPEYFDKTLVDVPCSMEGRFYAEDEKSYRDWSPRKVKELSEIQKWILRSAISSTKVGGTIVYSTCTLSPEENEGVIDWILKKENGAIELEEINLSGLPTIPGITKWNNRVYDENLSKTARILPSNLMEGFFVAKLRKVKSNILA